jgi:fructokinase
MIRTQDSERSGNLGRERMNPLEIAGIGEVLWDVFPDGELFGGAPANFACHCRALGARSYVIGCIGDDARGERAVEFLRSHDVDTSALAVSDVYETGTVVVTLDAAGKPSYEIKEGVAWDHLPYSDNLDAITRESDAVCFGTLGQRHATSRETIRKFLAATPSHCLRVYDINLRQSYFTEDTIRASLDLANALKLNDEELQVIAPMHDLEGSDETIIHSLLESYELELVALTRGTRGSLIVTQDAMSDAAGVEVAIADTVGAGDAFTAAMITGYLNNWSLDKTNQFANRVAAYVCSQFGAVPELPETLRSFAASPP